MIRQALWLWALSSFALAANLTTSKIADSPAWNETWTDKLKQHLLTKYDKFARPSQHYNTTTVNVRINVVTVEVDDKENVMAANVWLMMLWNDDKLKWNSSEYSGLKSVHLGAHEIWLPDIYLLNSATHGTEYYGDRHCIVSETGRVLWVAPTIFHGYCHLDFTFWPFEMNTCRLSLSSWTYDGTQLNLTLTESGVDPGHYVPISEWVLRNLTANRREEVYDCCSEPYITVDFEFELSRSSEFYYHIIFVPTVPIVFLSLITFWLQPQSEMKLIINASSILIVVLYLIYFGYKVPPRYDSMPIIVKFYSACLYQATISLIISTFVINIKKFSYFANVPRPIRRFLLGKPGRYLGLGHIIREMEALKSAAEHEIGEDHPINISMSTSMMNFGDSQQTLSPTTSVKSIVNLEWILLATAIDRLIFLLFSFTFIAMAISYVRINRFTFNSDNTPYWHMY